MSNERTYTQANYDAARADIAAVSEAREQEYDRAEKIRLRQGKMRAILAAIGADPNDAGYVLEMIDSYDLKMSRQEFGLISEDEAWRLAKQLNPSMFEPNEG